MSSPSQRRPGERIPLQASGHAERPRGPHGDDAARSAGGAERRLLTVREAARYAGFSESSLRKWSDRGLLAVYRTPGGQRRFATADLDEFIVSMHEPPSAGGQSGAATERDDD
jgi:excisionase family DNA binding protein